MKKRKLIVLVKLLKQFIFGRPAWEKCRPKTLSTSQALFKDFVLILGTPI